MSTSNITEPNQRNGWKTFGIIIIILALLVCSFWIIKRVFFPNQFSPITLSTIEQDTLNQKLTQLNLPTIDNEDTSNANKKSSTLEPEAYSEINATREVSFNEREINALIAHNTDLADKLAIDLSENLASAKFIMPLDPDMPLFGGRTLNLKAGIELAYNNGQPIVRLKGVSAWGVPVPNAWMGNLKNIDLVNEFGGGGFWGAFSDGIEYMKLSEGSLIVKLKE